MESSADADRTVSPCIAIIKCFFYASCEDTVMKHLESLVMCFSFGVLQNMCDRPVQFANIQMRCITESWKEFACH
jgi:hypothetical protein